MSCLYEAESLAKTGVYMKLQTNGIPAKAGQTFFFNGVSWDDFEIKIFQSYHLI